MRTPGAATTSATRTGTGWRSSPGRPEPAKRSAFFRSDYRTSFLFLHYFSHGRLCRTSGAGACALHEKKGPGEGLFLFGGGAEQADDAPAVEKAEEQHPEGHQQRPGGPEEPQPGKQGGVMRASGCRPVWEPTSRGSRMLRTPAMRPKEQPQPGGKGPAGRPAPAQRPQGTSTEPLPTRGSRSNRAMARAAASGLRTPSSHSPAATSAKVARNNAPYARSSCPTTSRPKARASRSSRSPGSGSSGGGSGSPGGSRRRG